MATTIQQTPQDHRSNDVSSGLMPGNVHSMSNFPQGLTYTEFGMDDARYSTRAPNGSKATSDGALHPSYRWNSAPDMETRNRKEPFDDYSPPHRPAQQITSAPATSSMIPQAQVYEVAATDPRALQDPNNSLQIQPGRARSPRGLSPTRDYTIPRQSANMGNYYPQAPTNGYPSHQANPSTSSYNAAQIPIPVSPNLRAFAQQPTYITPPANSTNPVYMRPQAPKEEVCLECAMRDQDMADVDVTNPGAWERDSDVFYADLVQREEESQRTGIPLPVDPQRPAALADLLSETNMKVHLATHPREPASRQKNLETYVKAQRLLLEAETLAHAMAMQESRQLDSKMRDTYSQLRRSAYEVGSSTAVVDDASGLRIKTPRAASMPSGAPVFQSHSREVTLLENGMIMEHVNVKREERDERERRRKEGKRDRSRARKSSRGSGVDVNSVYSTLNPIQPTDSGFTLGSKGVARYSQSSLRPTSVLSTHGDRSSTLPTGYSAASFSDLHSITSATSPNRRTRFFGLKNLSGGWKSRDSLAMSGVSGSMMDMHVALQQEQSQYPQVDISSNAPTLRMGETWPRPGESRPEGDTRLSSDGNSRKKKKGLAKIWGIVTGASKYETSSRKGSVPMVAKSEDDYPLTPPPPLSYLVEGERGSSRRHASTPSLPTSMTQSYPSSPQTSSVSPATAPSSILPSPTSTRENRGNIYDSEHEPHFDEIMKARTMPNLSQRPESVMSSLDKSLPPLPTESSVNFPSEVRPQTMFALDQRPSEELAPPRAPFRSADVRRQSFGGVESRPGSQNFTYNGTPGPVAANYGEFGASRLSLGWWEDARRSQGRGVGSVETTGTSKTASKRRSKFALSSFFGKKDRGDISASMDHESYQHSMPTSENEPRAFAGPGVRMSVTSRKAVQDLVDQDPDFVAYRYPSNDQRLDLFRP